MTTRTIKRAVWTLAIFLAMARFFVKPAEASASCGKCYTISSGTTSVYENSSLTRKSGSVSGSEEIRLLSISGSNCKISYKDDGKKKTGYIAAKAVLCGRSGDSCKLKKKLKVFRRPGGSSYGSASKGSRVKILGVCGKYTQIRFSHHGTRFGFVRTAILREARR